MADEKEIPEGSVISDVGVTEPPQIFAGDGVTPSDGIPPAPENMEPGPAAGIPEGEEPAEGSVISPAGVTAPTEVYKGDGVTPVEEEATPQAEPEAEQASYDDMYVADLKALCDERGIEYKSDWIKGDFIKALKKADKKEAG